ncbi:MAG: hypothetical protein ABIJ48_07430 [Actinomycetota bacterium]
MTFARAPSANGDGRSLSQVTKRFGGVVWSSVGGGKTGVVVLEVAGFAVLVVGGAVLVTVLAATDEGVLVEASVEGTAEPPSSHLTRKATPAAPSAAAAATTAMIMIRVLRFIGPLLLHCGHPSGGCPACLLEQSRVRDPGAVGSR